MTEGFREVGWHALVLRCHEHCAMNWGTGHCRILFKPLWTKVHETSGHCRGPLYFATIIYGQKIFAIKSRSRRKTEKCMVFLAPKFLGRTTSTFPPRFTVHGLAKFGWVPFADLRTQNLRRVGKNCGPILKRLSAKIHDIWKPCEGDPL